MYGQVLTPQSLNRYAYVLGNPISGIDPSGLVYTEANGYGEGCRAETEKPYLEINFLESNY